MTQADRITSDECVVQAASQLVAMVPEFAKVLPQLSPLPLRLRADGFGALVDAIIGQQISTAAAAAIAARMKAADLVTPVQILAASDEELRAAGQSVQKIKYLRALAAADLNYEALRRADTAEVLKTLTALPGIGPWTAEIYAMFSLGHADVFPAGDLALQEAAKLLFDLPERPKPKAMRQMAEAWSPFRSVAARLLWAYYREQKKREGIR
ncbi:DNA-3-methyladenine glycosylase family protein [Halocynthiibacter styelae]|uniref:DNA-3-methyladenine glycosylase II n=1 Tax=Halocynthiibacter styelae TaxID=2761955 RepID=A0A8J7INI0_9RHOB|nr:DNA-3-methyladenine glycosylase 2 family protein [Paenihalocynthiibacter styelae]MBI1492171.1 DNA-3-methyladenine glycosylase 2 family protein [Paenihalocynthiibacter styelae]